MEECLIKPDSLYAAVYDQASVGNKPKLFNSLMEQAKKAAKKDGEDWAALFYFNSLLGDLAKDGQLLSWLFLFSGIYKVKLGFHNPNDQIENEYEKDRFIGEGHFLDCPTGKIVVSCLADVGTTSLLPIFTIKPGRYTLSIWCNRDQEDKHTFLEDFSLYPNNDSPDWLLLFSPF